MTYSITAMREKTRFLCSDLDIEDAEFLKRKLECDGWVAIIVRNEETTKNADTNTSDASGVMDGIDEHKQTRNATQARFPWFLATCGFVAIALISYLIYIASLAFPIVGELFRLIGGVLLTFGLTVVTVKFMEWFMK